jgi:exonuclease III
LLIAPWNANGLQNHKDELKLFLNQTQINVMLISETHFTSKSHFSIAGYNIFLANHPGDKAHGGTAILIKSQIAYAVQTCYVKPELQASIIQVQGPHRNITIAATY